MDHLSRSRSDIDRIDRELIRLLAERMDVVREVGAVKQEHGELPLRDPERERALFEFWAREGEARGLSAYFLGRVLREVLNWSRRDQERLLARREAALEPKGARVGYQGAPASYSELAIQKLFHSRPRKAVSAVGFHSFAGVVDALVAGELDYGLLPIENTIAGSINEVYQLLGGRKVHVVDEEYWPVEHVLAGLPGAELAGLRVVRSHPVALQQCARFLSALVGAVAESHYDTAAAAESVRGGGDPGVAAICSAEAAQRAGLVVLREHVADAADNTTRFLLVARAPEPVDPRLPSKTSLAFTVNHRRGALAECLQTFARAGINLTKLESRPLADSPFEYLFYVDVEGSAADVRVAAALDEVRRHVNHLRVLGSYPNRAEVGQAPLAVAADDGPAPEPAPAPAPRGAASPTPAAPRPVPAAPKELKLSALAEDARRTVVKTGTALVGPDTFTLIAGPCAVESRRQVLDAAEMVKRHGAHLLRGGAFKPRSSPYAFQGLGLEGLELLAEAGAAFELPVVTEVLRPEDVAAIAARADVLQVGARNMQNFELLKELGHVDRPVLLKRGMSATVRELLQAAEYVMAGGNQRVILCERGIRTFETATRNTLDVSAVPVLKERTHLPVIVDPSHAAGLRRLVLPLALAAAAVGADGLIVEAHPRPEEALCDKDQALTDADLGELRRRLGPILAGRGVRWA